MNTLSHSSERKWLLYVNGLFMSGHYTYVAARKVADKFSSGLVEIKTVVKGA